MDLQYEPIEISRLGESSKFIIDVSGVDYHGFVLAIRRIERKLFQQFFQQRM